VLDFGWRYEVKTVAIERYSDFENFSQHSTFCKQPFSFSYYNYFVR